MIVRYVTRKSEDGFVIEATSFSGHIEWRWDGGGHIKNDGTMAPTIR